MKVMQLTDFDEVWLVTFTSEQIPGEQPKPTCLKATEYHTGRILRLQKHELASPGPPYSLGTNTLFVAFDAPAALGCHLAFGWPLPARVLDLHAEFRCLTSGLTVPGDYDLPKAIAHFGVDGDDEGALAKLLTAMLPHLDLPRAILLRGRYTAAVARMEAVGVPIDMPSYRRLRDGWQRIQDDLIKEVDHTFGVYQNGRFNPRRWKAWLNRQGIPWPRRAPGRLDLQLVTFRDVASAYPEIGPMKELRASLSQMRLFGLAVGSDGRGRCSLRPFSSKTGRNQPRSREFIFGPAVWLRGLIKPPKGMALAYLDYEQQEFGIAAALSGDQAMQEAYRSGDPYLAFAKQAGAVPPNATKATHRDERERFKHCALGVQYGMGAVSLALRLGISVAEARELLRLHRQTYPTYWRWSKEVGRVARREGRLQAAFGWALHVAPKANPRSLRNFPLQANGAEMLRLACMALTEEGVRICAPVHDALLIEAPSGDIERVVAVAKRVMRWASQQVLQEFPLRAESKVVQFPERYMDPRGKEMWDRVFGLLDRHPEARCA
jgi:hypothetical protein